MNFTPLFISHICAAYMCGVIWIIQLIQYPSFAYIEHAQFAEAHQRHSSLMGVLVGPVMILELLAGLWLLSEKMDFFSSTNFTMIALLWFFTFYVSVPLHNQLSAGFRIDVIQKLIATNWPRTILWTAKLGLISCWLLVSLKS
jgi:hypothetical protein